VLYNLCNEPWLKYSLGAIADRSLKSKHWTSVRLRAEVLYMETSRCTQLPRLASWEVFTVAFVKRTGCAHSRQQNGDATGLEDAKCFNSDTMGNKESTTRLAVPY
jgi:hypothetical protein